MLSVSMVTSPWLHLHGLLIHQWYKLSFLSLSPLLNDHTHHHPNSHQYQHSCSNSNSKDHRQHIRPVLSTLTSTVCRAYTKPSSSTSNSWAVLPGVEVWCILLVEGKMEREGRRRRGGGGEGEEEEGLPPRP